jgi:outer membrane lipoprotein-sorting protein
MYGSLLVSVCLVAIGLAGWSGCAPAARLTRERILSVEEVLRRVAERNARISTLRGDGRITVESPEASNTGSFDVRLRKPDSVLVEFSGPLGIRVGTLAVSRKQFVYYDRMQNRALVGVPDGRTLHAAFNLSMEFDDILRAFTGEFSSTVKPDESLEQFTVEKDLYVLTYRSGEERKEYRIDGDNFIVASYRIIDREGKNKLYALAAETEQRSDIAMPMLIRVVLPRERRSVTIAYSDVAFNRPVVCSFALPGQAEIIHR